MSGFKIATYNANSIRVRLPQILDWLARENPDVLCVQETKVQDKDFPLQAFQEVGYHVVFRGQKSYAGVAMISRNAPEKVFAGFEDELDAPRLLRGVYRDVVVINTYVPQGRDVESDQFQYKLQWLAQLRTLFETNYTPEQPIVWVGDFNVATQDIDVYNPAGLRGHVDFHPVVQTALEHVRTWGFVDVFRRHHPDEPGHYSYWDYRAHDPITRGVGWRIDHIWATPTLAQKSICAWIDVDARRVARASDHTFVVAEFS
ncbi:MAG: exodeoxyribonuclease III [Anaerolineae bacterium]|nr:exodeoxyribonuclease III [Anaerolineae bacterium]